MPKRSRSYPFRLIGDDGVEVHAPEIFVDACETLIAMADVMDGEFTAPVPVPGACGEALKAIVDMCTHDADPPTDVNTLYGALNAADFLNCSACEQKLTQAIASRVVGKTVECIRDALDLHGVVRPRTDEKRRFRAVWTLPPRRAPETAV